MDGAGQQGVGYDFAHAIIYDHTRLGYVELHNDERAQTVTEFVARALNWFEGHGITAKRLMSDNAWTYTHNRSLRELLAAREIKHLRTQPYRPQTNGKVERFHQTMAREWAHAASATTHTATATKPCHTSSSTTTRAGHTQESATSHPSTAFTTYVGRTTRPGQMHLLGRCTNPSAPLEAVFEALPDEPLEPIEGPAPESETGRLGNGVVQRAVVKVLAEGGAMRTADIHLAVERLLGRAVSKESVSSALRKGIREPEHQFERVAVGCYRLRGFLC
jgi:transposase InsO family protein